MAAAAAPCMVMSSSLRSNSASTAGGARTLTSSSTSSTGAGSGTAQPAKKGLARGMTEREEAEAQAAREAAVLALKNQGTAASTGGVHLVSVGVSPAVNKLGFWRPALLAAWKSCVIL
jgi:hypothetical protein